MKFMFGEVIDSLDLEFIYGFCFGLFGNFWKLSNFRVDFLIELNENIGIFEFEDYFNDNGKIVVKLKNKIK